MVSHPAINYGVYVGQSSTVDLDPNPADISHATRIQYFFSSSFLKKLRRHKTLRELRIMVIKSNVNIYEKPKLELFMQP